MGEFDATLPQHLRDRLDALRDLGLEFAIRFIPPGSPESHGRRFGVWCVACSPPGSRAQPAAREHPPGLTPGPDVSDGPHSVHAASLPVAVALAIATAAKRWPAARGI